MKISLIHVLSLLLSLFLHLKMLHCLNHFLIKQADLKDLLFTFSGTVVLRAYLL